MDGSMNPARRSTRAVAKTRPVRFEELPSSGDEGASPLPTRKTYPRYTPSYTKTDQWKKFKEDLQHDEDDPDSEPAPKKPKITHAQPKAKSPAVPKLFDRNTLVHLTEFEAESILERAYLEPERRYVRPRMDLNDLAAIKVEHHKMEELRGIMKQQNKFYQTKDKYSKVYESIDQYRDTLIGIIEMSQWQKMQKKQLYRGANVTDSSDFASKLTESEDTDMSEWVKQLAATIDPDVLEKLQRSIQDHLREPMEGLTHAQNQLGGELAPEERLEYQDDAAAGQLFVRGLAGMSAATRARWEEIQSERRRIEEEKEVRAQKRKSEVRARDRAQSKFGEKRKEGDTNDKASKKVGRKAKDKDKNGGQKTTAGANRS